MIKNIELQNIGFTIVDFPLESVILEWLKNEDWKNLDDYFLAISKPDGLLNNFLAEFLDFQTLEHIIAIRSAPDDEDGIWHDDGSRFLGFSLSLNINPETISGGNLLFKKKIDPLPNTFPPQPMGKMIIFLSGIYGYEHMVSSVTSGKRIVIAGWCGSSAL